MNTFRLISGAAAILLIAIGIRKWSKRGAHAGSGSERFERRRSYRVALRAPVFVYGWRSNEPFAENTNTLNVSAAGGLLPLSAEPVLRQELILTNLQTNEDVSCRVTRWTASEAGETLVGVEFLQPAPNFWQVEFVPSRRADAPMPPPVSAHHDDSLRLT